MAYYDALKAQWATIPAGDTTQQKLDAINAMTITGPAVDVPVEAVVGELMLTGDFLILQSFSQSANNSNATHDNAVSYAKMLMAMVSIPNAPPFAMSDPTKYATIKDMMDAILAQEEAQAGSTGFTQAVHDALLALSASTVPWWQANGYKRVLNMGDVVVAGLDTTTGYSAIISAPGTNQFNVTVTVTVTGPKGSESFPTFAVTLDADYAQYFAANCVQNAMTRDASLATFG